MVQYWHMYPLGMLYKQSQINGYLCISVYDVNKALCSFTETFETPHYQHMYDCNDCKISICIVCSNVCHNGHDIVYEEYKKTYCECGANTQSSFNKPCDALNPRASKPCSLIEIQTRSPSELTNVLIGDQKTLQQDMDENEEEQGDSSFMAENNENDTSTLSLAVPTKRINKKELLEVINRQSIAIGTLGYEPSLKFEDEEERHSENRIDIE